MILLDNGPIVAFFDASDHYYPACIKLLKTVNEPIINGKIQRPPLDLADGTLVTLAESQRIKKVFTLDHKDFRIYKTARIKNFTLIPARI